MFQKMISLGFGKSMIIALILAVAVNAFLCYERKLLQAENHAFRTEAEFIRADNQNLANQLERANLAVTQYQQQIKTLHDKVLSQLTKAEARTNDILNELEKHQNWRNQPVPTGVSRLLNQRQYSLSANRPNAPDLPAIKPVPAPPISDSK